MKIYNFSNIFLNSNTGLFNMMVQIYNKYYVPMDGDPNENWEYADYAHIPILRHTQKVIMELS